MHPPGKKPPVLLCLLEAAQLLHPPGGTEQPRASPPSCGDRGFGHWDGAGSGCPAVACLVGLLLFASGLRDERQMQSIPLSPCLSGMTGKAIKCIFFYRAVNLISF